MLAAIHHQLGALLRAAHQVGGHLVSVLAGDEGSHLGVRVAPRADPDLRQAFPNGLDQRIGDISHRCHHADRHAALAGGSVGGRDRRIGRHANIRVRQHHHVVLRTTQRLAPLAGCRGVLVDIARHRGRTHEADRRDVGMLEDGVHGHLVAVHHVEHAVR